MIPTIRHLSDRDQNSHLQCINSITKILLPLYFSVIRCLNISLLICISHTYNPNSSAVILEIRRLYWLTSVFTHIVNFLYQEIFLFICCPSVKNELSRRHLKLAAPIIWSHANMMLSPIFAYWIVPEWSATVYNAIKKIEVLYVLM